MKNTLLISLMLTLALTSGCSWLGFDEDEQSEEESSGFTERDFYDKIQSSLNSKNWTVAITN